ncbi:S8 family serine peptidase [Streptomyces sp. B1866]|uniref:S8 family serine peptidase n=1 Tax=Streptomyces sp. B1866 TaxID=3075431 RepID=UPI0028921899|nr:S8 family serine peptidase [Streptomyces sp. B1866]MDT3395306.1 S8 family serine peptidase [Streptomyces sp. B1866]
MIHRSRAATSAIAASLASTALLAAATLPLPKTAASSTPSAPTTFLPLNDGTTARTASKVTAARAAARTAPWSPAECRAAFGHPCYGPTELHRLYGVDKLHERGIDGAGQTIAVVMPMRNKFAQDDLDRFSDGTGLPRTRIEVIERGDVPDPDPSDPVQGQNVEETNIDLALIHAMAPGAHLILVSTPVNITSGAAGWKEVSEAVDWLTRTRHITAINFSYGVYEQQLAEDVHRPGDYRALYRLRQGLAAASARGTTLVAATGDTGPTGPNLAGTALYPERAVPWPASDPVVTGVGGSELHADDQGYRTAPDTLWTANGTYNATGAGTSRAFWPARSTTDITMAASPRNRVLAYSSVNVLPGQEPGWIRVAGTSAAAPLFAGLVALAAQQAGHPLGRLDAALARITPGSHGTQDVTDGCNDIPDVTGYCAHPGRDIASGVGTVRDAAAFTRALARR